MFVARLKMSFFYNYIYTFDESIFHYIQYKNHIALSYD